MAKLYCKFDELAKLECKFDELDKLRMSSMSLISCTVSWVSWLSCTVSLMSWISCTVSSMYHNYMYEDEPVMIWSQSLCNNTNKKKGVTIVLNVFDFPI